MSRPRLPLKRQIAVWRARIAHKWREFWAAKYTGLGQREIEKLPDDDVVYRVFDYIFQHWMSFDRARQDYDTSRLTPAEKAVWFAWDVDCEVNNGGFNQYFFNKATRPTEPVLDAYSLIKAEAHRELFLAAIDNYQHVIESHVSAMRTAKGNVPVLLEAFSATYKDNPLNDLDGRYYSISPDLEDILRSFIRSNPNAFKRK